ncbi:MAG: fasciclin domain-containing protein [Ilumatobacteraceae bacterium]
MKSTRTRMFAAGLVAGVIALSACGDDGNDSEDTVAATEPAAEESAEPAAEESAESMEATVVDVAIVNDFTTLVAAVEAAGLVETLQGEGPFTVFAPTNEAFAALPDGLLEALLLPENQEALQQILTYHVVSGKVLSTDLASGEVATVQGEEVTIVVDDGVTVEGANVVIADIEAGNGVVHVIDAVIVPPSIDPAALLGG